MVFSPLSNNMSRAPEPVDDKEDIARFLYSSSWYNILSVKPAAFLPSPNNKTTSVTRYGKTPVSELIERGKRDPNQRRFHGLALVKAKDIRDVGLDVVPDEPPPRHANIVAWPWNAMDPESEKADQLLLATKLATRANKILV